ncbi:MAG: MFS transporter [Candidatus Thorarchaeota archaeon]|nr:MAG: MFS transporter [Candidatus Thorarchaeota archaeon]
MIEDASKRSDWKALTSVYNSAFFCSLGFFVVRFLIPIIAYGSMGATATEVALIFSLLTLGVAIFSPVAGKFARRGRRRGSIFVGTVVRAIAYFGMAISVILGDKYILIMNSLLWGLGAAFYNVGSDAEISERVLHENRAEAFGKREASNGKGSVIGAFIGFSILFSFPDSGIVLVFLFYAVMNLIGGFVVIANRPPLEAISARIESLKAKGIISLGIAALVIAAAIDTFISALLSPFVELYIIDQFTSDLALIALIYLPGGIISGIFGGYLGRFADHRNKVVIVSAAVIIGAISTLALVFMPLIFPWPYNLISIAFLFSIGSVTGIMAYTVMSAVFGTAYEGRASEGFGMFEAAMGFSRFTAPLVGGLLWDYLDHSAPFLLVGFSGFILVPIYVYGMKQYERKQLESFNEVTIV